MARLTVLAQSQAVTLVPLTVVRAVQVAFKAVTPARHVAKLVLHEAKQAVGLKGGCGVGQ